ncbi:MAG: hypothetical protein JO055_10445 [Alphaproteobacteria bacterium]|nr:hypothetical protein [Alphaproteobacteria bacterium]
MHRHLGLLAASIIVSSVLASLPAAAETSKPGGVQQPPASASKTCALGRENSIECLKAQGKTGGPDTSGKPPHK